MKSKEQLSHEHGLEVGDWLMKVIENGFHPHVTKIATASHYAGFEAGVRAVAAALEEKYITIGNDKGIGDWVRERFGVK